MPVRQVRSITDDTCQQVCQMCDKKRNRKHLGAQTHRLLILFGARGRTRTDTALRPGDFKSPAATNYATRAAQLEAGVGIEPAYTALQAAA